MSKPDITVTVKSKMTEIENDWMSDLKVGDIVHLANGERGRPARICGKHETRHFPGLEMERTFDLMWLTDVPKPRGPYYSCPEIKNPNG